jgi:(1->4)-alpha-D-glucan 1-alpha-D-glucosylmutase
VFNSLSQTLVKISSPGVSDFYQGTELWDLNLVDPDNRRPVDFERRRAFLTEIKEKAERDVFALTGELLDTREDGRIKLFLISAALKTRSEHIDLFRNGSYFPLEVSGTFREHVIAFARVFQDSWAITVAPRFLAGLVREGEYPLGPHIWKDTRIEPPEGSPRVLRDVFTRELVQAEEALVVADVFRHFPAALLVNGGQKR